MILDPILIKYAQAHQAKDNKEYRRIDLCNKVMQVMLHPTPEIMAKAAISLAIMAKVIYNIDLAPAIALRQQELLTELEKTGSMFID